MTYHNNQSYKSNYQHKKSDQPAFNEPIKYYVNGDNKQIEIQLFNEVAEKWAKNLNLAQTQLRKFYNQVLNYRDQIENFSASIDGKEQKFNELLPYILMLKSKVHYAKNRKSSDVNQNFVNFIQNNLSNIKKYKDYKIFCTFFEAVVAFSKSK